MTEREPGAGSGASFAAVQSSQRSDPTDTEISTGSLDQLVRLARDDGTEIGVGSADPDLARLLARAARVNHRVESLPDLSFSSMLIALVGGDDTVSVWFRAYLSNTDVELPALLSMRNLTGEVELRELVESPVEPEELAVQLIASASSERLLRAARSIADSVQLGQALGVRHLIGAYIYNGAGHDRDFDRLGFNRPNWSVAFLSFMARSWPTEVDGWAAHHEDRYPDVALGNVRDAGPSTHITSDRWTTTDALGYSAYALALAKFVRHEDTVAPIAIGIQAPWGGGKTSLMQMLRQELGRDDNASVASTHNTTLSTPSPEPVLERPQLSVREVLGLARREASGDAPSPLAGLAVPPLTVWFNAWKYEGTNQVWAGLADAILHQVAEQLPVKDRETFWVRLNFRRIDPDRVRRLIHERLFVAWWQASRWLIAATLWLVGTALLVAAGGVITDTDWARRLGVLGGPASAGLGVLGLLATWLRSRRTVLNGKARVTLPDLVSIPPYEAELGLVHHVEEDVHRVLRTLQAAQGNRPVVIFVDDLDRCSPTKVAAVVEAVNLFLAGDLPRCFFVVGLDAELVAAALQVAHEQLTAHLPSEAATPLGWRFMDKFIQLPFVIPPPSPRDLKRYADALLGSDAIAPRSDPSEDPLDVFERILGLTPAARAALAGIRDRTELTRRVAEMRRPLTLAPADEARIRMALEAKSEREDIEHGVNTFSDTYTEIRALMRDAAVHFSTNPRELKRFVNTFRFQYFLSWAGKARTGRAVSLSQLQRWVILSLRWPEVVRWYWRGPHEAPRLTLLETVAGSCENYETWKATAPGELQLDPPPSWLTERALYAFFREESQLPPAERLTSGIGHGLW